MYMPPLVYPPSPSPLVRTRTSFMNDPKIEFSYLNLTYNLFTPRHRWKS